MAGPPQSEQESEHPLLAHLSAARATSYLAVTRTPAEAVALYRWNSHMSAALHESLGLAEVALRNAIDHQLRAWNQVQPPAFDTAYTNDWVENPSRPLWAILNPAQRHGGRRSTYQAAFHRALQSRDRRATGHPRFGAPITHDDVIAHITFGTWSHLIPRRDAQGRLKPAGQRLLWNQALKNAFPAHPDPSVIKFWVDRLLHLRNRVAHLEPLIDADILGYHRTIARLLRAIDPALGDWYAGTSPVISTYQRRPRLYR